MGEILIAHIKTDYDGEYHYWELTENNGMYKYNFSKPHPKYCNNEIHSMVWYKK